MSTGSATHPSLIQGISQQAPEARGTAACEHQENCLNEVLDGVVSRMGTKVLGSYFDVYQDPFVHRFKRSADEQYLVLVEGTALRVINRLTGALCSVSGNMTPYLPHTGAARKAFQAVTIGDTTFLLNRQRVVEMGTLKSPKRPNWGCVYFRAGGYKITYKLTIRVSGQDFTTTFETPDNSSPGNSEYIGTDYLAEQFAASLTTTVFPLMTSSGHSGFSVSRHGSTLILSGPQGKAYSLHTSDGAGDSHLISFVDSLDSVSNLPKRCLEGYIVSISPPGSVDGARYWLQYSGDTDSGRWEEVVSPDTPLGLDAGTMPHLLVCTAPDTFEVRQGTWGKRVSGDGSKSSPDPSYVGLPLRSLQFISGRLAAISEYTMALSRARNAYVFFPDTAQTSLDTAPIDYDITNGSSTDVEHSVVAGERLQFWSDGQQTYLDTGQEAIKEDSTEILPWANYEYDGEVAPAPVGLGSIIFGTQVGKWSRLTEVMLQRSQAAGEIVITDHVPKLIPGGLRHLAVGQGASKAIVLSSGDPKACYFYQWYNQGQDRVQSAWNVWKFPAVRKILWAGIHGSTATFLFQWDNRVTLESLVMDAVGDEPQEETPLRIDHRVDESAGTFDVDHWVVGLPFVVDLESRSLFRCLERESRPDGTMLRGREVPFEWINGETIRVLKDDPEASFFFGVVPVSRRRESPFFAKDRQDQTILHDNLVIRRIVVSHSDTVEYEVVVRAQGHEEFNNTYSSRIVGDPSFLNTDIPHKSGRHETPVGAKAEEVEIELVNSTPFRSTWTAIRYIYELTVRSP